MCVGVCEIESRRGGGWRDREKESRREREEGKEIE